MKNNAVPRSKVDMVDDLESLRHPGLQSFAKNLWLADGPIVRDAGLLFTTRMEIVRLGDGTLWVNSPVDVPPETLSQITHLGQVRYLVAGTPRHVWRLESWHALFPDAQLWAPKPTLFTLKKADLPLTGILGDTPNPGWADDLDQLAFKGSPFIEEIFFFHRESHTVILDDLIQSHLKVQGDFIRNTLIKIMGVEAPRNGVSIDLRLSFLNRQLARQSLERLLSWDFDKLIIAHGNPVLSNARETVETAFRWLL